MARYASKDLLNLKVGVTSFSEDLTSLEVAGRLGINTSFARQDLHVEGSAYFSNSVGIGTTAPNDAVDVNNIQVLNVGIVTANQYFGDGSTLSGLTTVSFANSIAGGSAGQLLYQHAPGITSFFDNGSTGEGLFSRGPGEPPQWLPTAPLGAIEGLTLFDEGAQVGTAGSFVSLDFRGDNISVIGVITSGGAGVGTVIVPNNMVLENLEVTGVTTLGVTSATHFNAQTIIVGTALTVNGPVTIDGNVTVGGTLSYSDVSNIDAVGLITARDGIHIGNPESAIGIAATLTKEGGAVFTGIVTTRDLIVTNRSGIGTDVLNPLYTLEVDGDTNIKGELQKNGNTVPSLAMVIALGGF